MKNPTMLWLVMLWLLAILLGHDIFIGRWDWACFNLAMSWACCEVGIALARVLR